MNAGMSEGEKLDHFVDGLKYNVKIEVMKANCNFFEECSKIALNVDSVIWRAKKGLPDNPSFSSELSKPSPMEVENLARRVSSKAQREQRQKDLSKGACFKCHKGGCRPCNFNLHSRTNNIDERIYVTSEGSSVVFLIRKTSGSTKSK